MDARQRSRLVGGLILILLGAWFLAVQIVPGLNFWARLGWPLIIIAVGVGLLLIGLVAGEPGMAVPACIVGGIGALLAWQNATGNWDSWAYAWALIPGFVGVGIILAGVLGRETQRTLRGGAWLIVISLVLFLVFGSFLGGRDLLGPYWPLLLIGLGALLLGRSFLRGR